MNLQDQVLLVQEYGSYWGLPRGHIESEEGPLEASTREIAEEAGITNLQYIREIGSYERSTFDENGEDDFREIKHMTFFMFRTEQTELNPRDKNITNARWVDPEAVPSYLINSKDKEFYLRSLPVIKNWILKR